MKMNDSNGCSMCKNGEERYESCKIMRRKMCQYDYRTEDGKLFSCVKPTLEQCRIARDAWLKKKDLVMEEGKKINVAKERFDLIHKCLERYYILLAPSKNKLQDMMDIDFSRVNVWKLIQFDNANFLHDMNGIFRHIDRKNECLKDCFVPRAGLMQEKDLKENMDIKQTEESSEMSM